MTTSRLTCEGKQLIQTVQILTVHIRRASLSSS